MIVSSSRNLFGEFFKFYATVEYEALNFVSTPLRGMGVRILPRTTSPPTKSLGDISCWLVRNSFEKYSKKVSLEKLRGSRSGFLTLNRFF
jgi:hypothetical protein